MQPSNFLFLANGVLICHVGVVLFIVAGQILVLIGAARHWTWVRNRVFRALHLAAIVYVAVQTWFGMVCPLTTLEQWLRFRAGQVSYQGDFIGYWLSRLLFYQAPPWVFVSAYSAFAALVAASWWWAPPRRRT